MSDQIQVRPLFTMKLRVDPMRVIGETPGGFRRVGVVTGGTFEGKRISGSVLDGGNDWQIVRKDGSVTLDVRLNLKTDDGEIFGMIYRGIRDGSPEILKKIDQGEEVDPASYYFRTTAHFETASKKYDWLNRIVAVGSGHRTSSGPVYNVFEVL